MRDRERERTKTIARKGVTTDKQTKYPSLSGDWGGGGGTQTNQWWSASKPRPDKGG